MNIILFIMLPSLVSAIVLKYTNQKEVIKDFNPLILLLILVVTISIIEILIFSVFGIQPGLINIYTKFQTISQYYPLYGPIYSAIIFFSSVIGYGFLDYLFNKIKKNLVPYFILSRQQLVFIIFIIYTWVALNWLKYNFSVTDIESIFLHLNFVRAETNILSMVMEFFQSTIFWTGLIVTYLLTLLFISHKENRLLEGPTNLSSRFVLVAITTLILFDISNTLEIVRFISNSQNPSLLIEENYVDPLELSYDFPDKKRNLILIYLESMESSYANSGHTTFEDNLIPNLEELSIKYPSFTYLKHTNNGFLQLDNSGATISGMFSSQTGLPLKYNLINNSVVSDSIFMPNVIALGDILEDNNYSQTFLIGSDGEFGNRKSFFENHGNFYVNDYFSAIEDSRIPEDYNVWWGYEDSKLLDFAKAELLEMSKLDQPFNFTMLTTNTHSKDGYLEEDCATPYVEQYSNVIACEDERIFNFIQWIKTQEFYEDSTIVVLGDHLSMDPLFFNGMDYQRSIYNVFIGEHLVNLDVNEARIATHLDLFPTILSSLDVDFEGSQIALGINLFSATETLAEKYGFEELNEQLNRTSEFYIEKFLIPDN